MAMVWLSLTVIKLARTEGFIGKTIFEWAENARGAALKGLSFRSAFIRPNQVCMSVWNWLAARSRLGEPQRHHTTDCT